MTPFGEKLRILREKNNVSQKDMARELGVSAAYLSALEHGHKGKPHWSLVQRVITFFNIIWDDAEELQKLALHSDPGVKIVTAGLEPNKTLLANLLARKISKLESTQVDALIKLLQNSSK